MKILLNFCKKNTIWTIVFVYFLFRLTNLTLLPIFNDEAIYLDWGWRETHTYNLFYSLYDAKQPLLMWIFGLSESVIKNPLFAGRLVSIVAGFFTMIGLYKISCMAFSKRVAIIAACIYICIPIFSFYDRQALMESAVATVGTWSLWLLLQIAKSFSYKKAFLLGALLGVGFFIKSTSLLYLFPLAICTVYIWIKHSSFHITRMSVVVVGFLLVLSPLLLQQQFWNTFASNNRYTLTLAEFLSFPFSLWTTNIWNNLQILFFYVSPAVFFCGVLGIMIGIRKRNTERIILLIWLGIPIFIESLLIRTATQRYLVAFLPLLCIFAAAFLSFAFAYSKKISIIPLFITLGTAGILTLLQLSNPPLYFLSLSKFTQVSENGYIRGFTSGYGLPYIQKYLEDASRDKAIFVGIANHTGNPESAILVYAQNNPLITVSYLDGNLMTNSLQGYDCISVDKPLYFVSRGNDTVGLGRFLQKDATITNPYDKTTTIGLYAVKKNCVGKTALLVPKMQ